MSNGPFEQPSFQEKPPQANEPVINIESVIPSLVQEIQRITGKDLDDDQISSYRYGLENLICTAHTYGDPQVTAAIYKTAAQIVASHGNDYQWDEIPLP